MAPVYSKQLYAARVTPAGHLDLADVPVGKVWVVRDVALTPEQTGTGQRVDLQISTSAGNVNFYRNDALDDIETVHLDLRVVVDYPYGIGMFAPLGGFDLVISGYELTAAP